MKRSGTGADRLQERRDSRTNAFKTPSTSKTRRLSKPKSGLSSNDGRVSDPLPARSNGLDTFDGGPDAGGYSAPGAPEQGRPWLTERKSRPLCLGAVRDRPLTFCETRPGRYRL